MLHYAIVGVSFTALAATGWARAAADRKPRSRGDWTVDLSGLFMQGVVVPLVEATVLYAGLCALAPGLKGAAHVPGWAGFLLNFALVDYAYYWNHRLLHGRKLWRFHAVHHTAETLDVWITSRNTLWSPFLIVYVWLNAWGAYLLADPAPFVLGAAVTAALDLWRHSGVSPRRPGPAFELLRAHLITPDEHAWHHSTDRNDVNFGANLNWWDRLHGTYLRPAGRPASLGVKLDWSLRERLLFPVST